MIVETGAVVIPGSLRAGETIMDGGTEIATTAIGGVIVTQTVADVAVTSLKITRAADIEILIGSGDAVGTGAGRPENRLSIQLSNSRVNQVYSKL